MACLVLHRDDAAVAAAHATSHHTFHRPLTASPVFCRDMRDGFEHWLGSARVDHHVAVSALQFALERNRHASAFAGAAVLGREHQLDAPRREPIQVEQLASTSRAVEQRRWRAALDERFSECGKRRESDTARHHPGFSRRIDCLEWFAEWTEARDDVAFDGFEQHARRDADAFAEEREARHAAVLAEDFEHREWTTQQRVVAATRLHHDELAWSNCGGDFRSSERDDVVVGREARVPNDLRLDVDGHSNEYTL